ncbi:MAG: hypothetical protein V4702_05950 [Patescibacteria group bacterium]
MNKRLILILAAIIIILLLIVVALWPSQNGQLFISDAFAANIQFPRVNESSIKYFTGSGFAEYDLSSHKTKSLTPNYALPNVYDVKWGTGGALFKASGYSPVDQLEPQLNQRGLAPDSQYWWLANFETGVISLVGSPDIEHNITDVVWLENSKQYMYLQFENDDAQGLYRADLGSAPALVGSIKPASAILWANQSSLIIAKPNGETLDLDRLQLPALSSEKITDDMPKRVMASENGQHIIYSQSDAKNGGEDGASKDLYHFDLNKAKKKLVSKGIIAQPIWSTSQPTFYVPLQEAENLAIVGFDAIKDKKHKFAIKDSSATPSFVFKIGAPKKNRFLLIDNNNLAYLASGDKKEFDSLPKANINFLANEKTVYRQGFYIAYFPNLNQYNIYITQEPYKANAQKALDFIKSQGVDPNQLFIKWYSDDRVNPTT